MKKVGAVTARMKVTIAGQGRAKVMVLDRSSLGTSQVGRADMKVAVKVEMKKTAARVEAETVVREKKKQRIRKMYNNK